MSDYVIGDRVAHERYGVGTVQTRATTSTAYKPKVPGLVRVWWDEPSGGREITTVLTCNVEPTTARK